MVDPRFFVAAAFALAAYQDFRCREVADWTWVPAVGYLAFAAGQPYIIDAAIAFAFLAIASAILYTKMGFGQADAIALPLLALDTSILAPAYTIIFSTIPLAADTVYHLIKYGGLEEKMTADRAVEGPWIPKAIEYADGKIETLPRTVEKALEKVKKYSGRNDVIVHCTYGTPLVGYLGIGYILKLLLQTLAPGLLPLA
jgi:hypothetical protein